MKAASSCEAHRSALRAPCIAPPDCELGDADGIGDLAVMRCGFFMPPHCAVPALILHGRKIQMRADTNVRIGIGEIGFGNFPSECERIAG